MKEDRCLAARPLEEHVRVAQERLRQRVEPVNRRHVPPGPQPWSAPPSSPPRCGFAPRLTDLTLVQTVVSWSPVSRSKQIRHRSPRRRRRSSSRRSAPRWPHRRRQRAPPVVSAPTSRESSTAAGATVVLVARRTDRLQALTDELGNRSLVVAADISSADARAEVFTRTLDEFGRVDCCSSTTPGSANPGQPPATDESMDEFRAACSTSTSRACFGLCQVAGSSHASPTARGSIVNVGSILGLVGSPQADVAYSASKGAGIESEPRRTSRFQWANRGVRRQLPWRRASSRPR